MSAFQIIGHDLPLIHVVLLMVDLLIGLMTLAAQNDDVLLLCMVHGPVDGLHPVHIDIDRAEINKNVQTDFKFRTMLS